MMEISKHPPAELRILSLDGGGVKGLASLLILQRVFRTLQGIERLPEMPRPCDYFDLIGGTSTGGLIAIMLGRLRMSIAECIDIFKHISKTVFGDTPGFWGRILKQTAGKPFFKAENLEKAIKDLLKARGIDSDAQFRESDETKCKVFVCSTRNIKPTFQNVLIRSYTTWHPTEENYSCYIWEAARATSAAPLFFEPLTMKSSGATFGDGALGLNNPISEVLNEADRLYPDARIKCTLSIGTGWTDIKGLDTSQLKLWNVLKTCVDLSINANQAAQAFAKGKRGRDMLNNKSYFRFDVDRNLDTIALEEWDKLDEIDGLTEAYLGRPEKENDLRDCASSLCRRVLSEPTTSDPSSSDSEPAYTSTLPQYSTPNFSGREIELAKIETIFQNSVDLHKRVALFGLGGIGKSQIAYEYATRHSDQRATFWVRANNLENMETGYRAIASLLKLDVHSEQHGVFFAVKQFLESDKSQPWLLILDEVDDKETVTAPASNGRKPMDYIPRSAKGQVLITTRDSRLVGLMDGHVVPAQNGIRIGPMPFEESLSLFLRCMRQELVHEATQEQYREFLDMLGGLPLALVQAASYMREEEATIEEFTSLYRDVEKHEDLFHESAITTDLEQRSVLCTWEISYARIAGPSYPDSKSQAAVVLDLLGFLDAQATSTRSLSEYEARFRGTRKMDAIRGLKHLLPIQESPSSLLSDVYESRFQNHNMFRATIGRLRNYSLVTSRECWVHPVVHSWIYRRLCLQERCKYISWMVEELLKHTRAPDLTSWEAILVPQYCVFKEMHYLRHAKVVLGYALSSRMTDYMTDHRISIPGFEELLYRIAEISASTGEAAKAIEYFEKSIRAAERSGSWGTLLDERRVRLAKVRSGEQSLAQDIAEAQFCLQAAPNCFDAKLWLAQCLNMSGERIQAIKLYEELMSLPQLDYQDLGNNKSLLIALCDVASIRAQTRTEENMTLARQSIDGIILPYISPIPQGNTVKAFLYPDILFTRMEVASSESDLRRVCRMMADYAYDERLGPPLIGGDPEELLPGIDKLWERGRWLEIEEFVGIYEESRWSITQIMAYNIEEPFNSELVSRTVLHWCELYNIQGKACFEQGKYAKAEEAHMKALGLHLYLHSEGSSSPEFRRNIYDLAGALAIQGQSKQKELDTIRRSFQDILAQMEPTQHSGTSHGRPKKRDFQEFSDEAG